MKPTHDVAGFVILEQIAMRARGQRREKMIVVIEQGCDDRPSLGHAGDEFTNEIDA